MYFDPAEYRVVLLDQRGCGDSRPSGCIANNTIWHLISDIEAIRKQLEITKWHTVFGGSWGSTLALAYAQAHPVSVGSMILRGICTMRTVESRWLNKPSGVAMLFPEKFEAFINFLPEDERSDHIASYNKRIIDEDTSISLPAARAWEDFGASISTLYPKQDSTQIVDPNWLLARSRIGMHYLVNKGWLEDGQLLRKENIDRIKHIPSQSRDTDGDQTLIIATATIVQGRYDVMCPPFTAWELHKLWPETALFWSEDAGHAASVSCPSSSYKSKVNNE